MGACIRVYIRMRKYLWQYRFDLCALSELLSVRPQKLIDADFTFLVVPNEEVSISVLVT